MFCSLTFLLVTEVFLLRSLIRILILVAATSIKINCFCHTQDLLIFLVGVVMAAAHRCGAQPRIGVLCFTIMPMQITPSSAPPQNRSHFAQAQKVAAFLFCSCPRSIREPMVWPQSAQQGHGAHAAPSQDARRIESHSRRFMESQPPTKVEIREFAAPGTLLADCPGAAILARADQIDKAAFWSEYPRIRFVVQATGLEDFSSAPHLATARPLLPIPPPSPISPLPPPSPVNAAPSHGRVVPPR